MSFEKAFFIITITIAAFFVPYYILISYNLIKENTKILNKREALEILGAIIAYGAIALTTTISILDINTDMIWIGVCCLVAVAVAKNHTMEFSSYIKEIKAKNCLRGEEVGSTNNVSSSRQKLQHWA